MSQTMVGAVSAELMAELETFYAHQMPLMEEQLFEAFAETFVEDCVFGYEGAWSVQGRTALLEGMRANIPRYGGATLRHWFQNRRAELLEDGAIGVTVTSLATITQPDGRVTLEPTCVVRDEIVRTAEGLRTRSRMIKHDLPNEGIYFGLGAGHE
jgi:actinorhodin biosynthesis protein ActVIA